MKIRLKVLIAGPRGVFSPGAVVDLPDAEAVALVDAGVAERVDAPPPKAADLETAAVEPDSEQAVMPRARPRKQTEDPDPDKERRK
jgi:hypothetical protein